MLNARIDKTTYAEILAEMHRRKAIIRWKGFSVFEGLHPKYGRCVLTSSSDIGFHMYSETETYPSGVEVYDMDEYLKKAFAG